MKALAIVAMLMTAVVLVLSLPYVGEPALPDEKHHAKPLPHVRGADAKVETAGDTLLPTGKPDNVQVLARCNPGEHETNVVVFMTWHEQHKAAYGIVTLRGGQQAVSWPPVVVMDFDESNEKMLRTLVRRGDTYEPASEEEFLKQFPEPCALLLSGDARK